MRTTNDERDIFLSTAPATSRDRRAAYITVGVSAVAFAVAVPFAKVPLPALPAFVATYQSALALCDLITAILLFSQFTLLRSRAVLFLACGYLFAALTVLIYLIAYPGIFGPTGLFGSGRQTVSWIYVFWHSGFPLFALAYILSRNEDGIDQVRGSVGLKVALSVVGVMILAGLLGAIAFYFEPYLPILVTETGRTDIEKVAVTTIWSFTLATLLILAVRSRLSVLDLWLGVVLATWLFDIALSTILNQTRFDLGYYGGRVYGLFAASFMLGVLLVDNVGLQAKVIRLLQQVRRQAASDRARYAEREHLFSALVESSSDAIITLSLDGAITSWNRAAERLFGYAATEAIGQPVNITVPPSRRCECEAMLARIGRGERIEHHETARITKDGRERDVSLSLSPILSGEGDIIGASAVARDITESKRTQRALSRETEERQRIFETSQDLILVTDDQTALVQVSPSSLPILGYRPDEMIGRAAGDFIDPTDMEGGRAEVRALRRGGKVHNFETRFLHKDGHSVTLNWMGTWSAPVRRFFFVGRDLTEKRAAEDQFRQAQKMEAIGLLTGGIAHDFNNILTVITGAIGILADMVEDRPDLSAVARLIDDSAERGGQLTRQLLAFARRQPLQPLDLDVNALVLDAAKLFRPTLGEYVEIETALAADAWTVLIDPNQLTTALLNLALNARDAMPQGGKLLLETSNVVFDDSYALANTEVLAGDYVMIAVSDTGCGIPDCYLDKVFEPFFSTKGVGKGTGLGLSMVFGFVKQSGGHIKIYSEVGHGTAVKIYLPRSTAAKPAAAAPVAVPQEIAGGHETILVVEDDLLVRQYVTAQVAGLGYETLAASNATEALDIIDSRASIDLLFTDVIMPGAMNGAQLAAAALERRPSLKVLFTSGYTENAVVHHGRLDAGVLLLAKPYRKPELARMIRVALEG